MSKDKLTQHANDLVVLKSSETVGAKPTVVRTGSVADSQSNNGPESIEVQSAESPLLRTTFDNPRQAFQGRPPRHDSDVLQVCRILRTALNDRGDTWGSFSEPSPAVNDAVATAADGRGDVLRVHVTRVDRASAKTIARGDPVIRRRSVGQRVTDIRVAVDSKVRQHTASQRGELLLALDVIRSPEHVDGAVVDAFRTAHHAYVTGLGYRAIWLVGPTGEMSRQVG